MLSNRLATAALFVTISPAAVLFAGPHMPRARFPKTWVRNMERIDMSMEKVGRVARAIIMRGRGGF